VHVTVAFAGRALGGFEPLPQDRGGGLRIAAGLFVELGAEFVIFRARRFQRRSVAGRRSRR